MCFILRHRSCIIFCLPPALLEGGNGCKSKKALLCVLCLSSTLPLLTLWSGDFAILPTLCAVADTAACNDDIFYLFYLVVRVKQFLLQGPPSLLPPSPPSLTPPSPPFLLHSLPLHSFLLSHSLFVPPSLPLDPSSCN